MERLPTRRDLERLGAWADLHRADGAVRAELGRRLEAEAGTTLLEHASRRAARLTQQRDEYVRRRRVRRAHPYGYFSGALERAW